MSITRTLAAALVIAALGVSSAQAQPADMHASTAIAAAKAAQKQDLRSPDARDAARRPLDSRTLSPEGMTAPRVATGGSPAAIAPTAKATPADKGPGVWLPIAIGAGFSLLAMAGLVAVNNRRVRRLHRVRVTA